MSARIYALQIGSALALTIGALWAGTQWAAAMLGYQAALGAPWVDLLGVKIYAPWKLFVWWLAFDAQAPDVFVRAGTVAALGDWPAARSRSGEPPGPQETNNNLRLGSLGGPFRCQGSAAARRSGCRAWTV